MADEITGAYPGHLACEYVNLGTYETPVFTRIKRVEDVDLPDERGTSEFRIKGSDFTRTIRGVRTKGVAFKYRKKRSEDLVFNELKEAYEDPNKCIEYAACDRPIADVGAAGFRGPFVVTKFNETRPFESVVEVDIELKFADADHPVDAPEAWEIEPFVTEAEV
tara:strand:- start:2125 stop:2616 length:492 start_codon:yes stop_codon:yes gene_type:complete